MAEAGGGDKDDYENLYIDGKIWIDAPGKLSEYDNLYNDGEKLYSRNVKVSLMNESGNVISNVTTNNGTYSLDTKIRINSNASKSSISQSLSGYYVKFEYESEYSEKEDNKEVWNRVNLVELNKDEKNSSKALAGEEKGVAYIYNLSEYVEKFYEYKNLSNMNMGLKISREGDYSISQDIAYIKVVMNGYTYTYDYKGTKKDESTAVPVVKLVDNKKGYKRSIYPSDIAYSKGNDSLKVYVVYRIDIKNNVATNYGKKKSETTEPVSYVEVGLTVSELYNKFDANRYEVERNYDSDKYDGDFKNWKDSGNGQVKYTGNKLDNVIVKGSPRTIFIQFKVTSTALNNLLNKKETVEDRPTSVTSKAYHKYWYAEYKWVKQGKSWVRKLIISDDQTHTMKNTSDSNYLEFNIGTERTIDGRVFEDKNIYNNGEVLGNGMYDNDENTIKSVKVELLAENGEKAKLYNSANSYNEISAETQTNNDGTYSFVGVTPGKYILRFTYGNGTQVLCSLNGTEYKETDTKITLDKYKSTIVTDDAIMKALGYEQSNKNEEWYKNVKSVNCSVAVDDLDQRAKYNSEKNISEINANTALMSISIENTKGNYVTITKSENGTKEKISGMNMGIIKTPEIKLAFDKVISNVQITNAQGNIIADGNPATQNMKVVNDLDKKEHLVKGSTYIKSEIVENELYGSTLRLAYSVTVQNNSDVNYYEKDVDKNNKYYGYYYKFGVSDINGISTEETITIDTVLDCLDPSIQYENIDNGHKVEDVDIEGNKDVINKIQEDTGLTYTKAYNITNWKELYSTKYKDNGGHKKEETQDTATLQAARLLSTQDNDLSVSNVAQVTKMHVTNTPSLIETVDTSSQYFSTSNPAEEVYATVTPPTGKDKITNIIYGVTSAIALLILSAGIIVIKKGFIDKNKKYKN